MSPRRPAAAEPVEDPGLTRTLLVVQGIVAGLMTLLGLFSGPAVCGDEAAACGTQQQVLATLTLGLTGPVLWVLSWLGVRRASGTGMPTFWLPVLGGVLMMGVFWLLLGHWSGYAA
ncbi:MAG: hypothetical protein Q8Q02_15280 [Nocardioides sp.]|nr:hypothetical protein [Nocardioides sp.]